MPQLAVGRKVPDFTATTTDGGKWRLKDAAGSKVVIFFYPKDMTSGCTVEAQQFRDLHAKFKRAGTLVVGVSRDSCASHARFRDKENLNYELLSDADEALCTSFDVIREKNMYGKKVFGIERSTFLIDAAGKLAREWRKVKADGHAAEVLAAAQAL
ncbi:MAG: peroxiredoxin [Steroidobacteraceae bacterium]|jgi:peroxiredoxin Q/BCP|nr:peroxiredoxin [Gammaproteobacteria bacterium]